MYSCCTKFTPLHVSLTHALNLNFNLSEILSLSLLPISLFLSLTHTQTLSALASSSQVN